MVFDQKIELLIALAKETNSLKIEDITAKFPKDSDEYEAAVLELERKGIDIIEDKELDDELFHDDEDIELSNPDIALLENEEEVDIENFDTLPLAFKVDDPVRMYLKEIGKMHLLTFEEETELAKTITNGKFASEQLKSMEELQKINWLKLI